VEASFVRDTQPEVVLGSLCPVPGTRDTFEGFWDIPENLAEGHGEVVMRLFDRGGEGAELLATDRAAFDLQHLNGGAAAANEDVRLLWPMNDGPLGFFRNKAGEWKSSIQVISSQNVTSKVLYSTTPLGAEPVFRECATGYTTKSTRTSDATDMADYVCKLGAGDRPSSVTAIAAHAQNGSHSSDAHRVHPFIQRSSEMQVRLEGRVKGGFDPLRPPAEYPSSRRRKAGTECLQFVAVVTDRFGRPVSGANVDVQLRGPGEDASFGPAVTTGVQDGAGGASAPDKARETQPTVDCRGAPAPGLRQGRALVVDGPDVKSIESTSGTNDAGRWGFQIYSREVGFSLLRAWVDSVSPGSDVEDPVGDDDQLGEVEASGDIEAHWLEAPLELDISPRDDSALVGSCRIYEVSAIAGRSALANFNLDFHIRTPDPELKICGVDDGVLNPPDSNHDTGPTHPPDEPTTNPKVCEAGGPACHHVEGVTNQDGKITFGISSALAGRATLIAWADGEPGQDQDVQGSRTSTQLVTNWVDEKGDSLIKLLAPSEGPGNPLQKVSDDSYRIVVRVAAPYLVDSVLIEVAGLDSRHRPIPKTLLGEATRSGNSHLYEFVWDLNRNLASYQSAQPESSPSPSPSASPSAAPPVTPPAAGQKTGVPDGDYTVTARLDQGRVDTRRLEVNRNLDSAENDANPPYEWAQITIPFNGAALGFLDGATRIAGTASLGAEGVNFYYTTAAAIEKPVWKFCGYKPQPGTSTASWSFNDAVCSLQGTDRAADVTAIAAAAFNCFVAIPGCAAPTPSPPAPGVQDPRPQNQRGTIGGGDAVGVFGCDGSPCMVLLPGEWTAQAGTCVPFTALATTHNQPAASHPVAVEFRGPTDRVRFCSMRGLSWDGPPEVVDVDPYGPDGRRISGRADDRGSFEFGALSEDSNFASIYSPFETASSVVAAWLDDGDARQESGESSARSLIHWELRGRCSVVGTDRNDQLLGTSRADIICGMGGDDRIFALEGNDVVRGGDGNDRIHGDVGKDLLLGDSGDDVLFGGRGKDRLEGGDGIDRCVPGNTHKDDVLECERGVQSQAASARSNGRRTKYV